MVHVPECAAWTWDARPYPFFPALTDVWTDGGNWPLGHWLTGRLGVSNPNAEQHHEENYHIPAGAGQHG